jgi:hypothetical protein
MFIGNFFELPVVNAAQAFCVNRPKGFTRIAIKEPPTLGRYTAAASERLRSI